MSAREYSRQSSPVVVDEIEETELDEQGNPPANTAVEAPDWSVQVFKAERTVFELSRRYKQDLLTLDPGFQRDDVWKSLARSRLIESVLARIPLPAIYLSQEDEERMLVVDGRQRLTTLFRFMRDEFSLRGLELLPRFEGKTFSTLDSRMQRRIEDTPLTTFIIQAGSDPQVKFHLFERLNRGGVELRPQEIRNGIYRGPGLELVQKLAPQVRQVAGEHRTYKHMKADELALRCCAMLHGDRSSYASDMEGFLNKTLLAMNKMSPQELEKLETRVRRSLDCCEVVFGQKGLAFVRYMAENGNGEWGRHLNLAVMDAEVVGFDQVSKPLDFWKKHRKDVRARLQRLHENDETFFWSVRWSTSSGAQLRYRIETWKTELQYVADGHP